MTMASSEYRTDITGVETGTFCANVTTTAAGKVRISILPPMSLNIEPMWVTYSRREAFRWALKVLRAALFGGYRETFLPANTATYRRGHGGRS